MALKPILRPLLAALAGLAFLIASGYLLYIRGFVRFNYPSAARFPIRGIDVSHHQGEIDWTAVKASRVEFAFIKASEGGDFRDREFARNWDNPGLDKFHLHARCFAAWEFERPHA